MLPFFSMARPIEKRIEVSLHAGGLAVWDAADAEALRARWRVTGSPVGPPADSAGGSARALLPEEAAMLVDMGVATVVDRRQQQAGHAGESWRDPSRAQRDRSALYQALWDDGYHLTVGCKFGAEYLAYRGDPNEVHAEATVHLLPPGQTSLSGLELIAAARASNSVRKCAMIAAVGEDGTASRIVIGSAPQSWNKRAHSRDPPDVTS
jgi:tRNA splicing endonuclease